MIKWCGECGGVIKYFILTDQIYQHLLINTNRRQSQTLCKVTNTDLKFVLLALLLCTNTPLKLLLVLLVLCGVRLLVSVRCEVVKNVTM